jgi:hypothetical protein
MENETNVVVICPHCQEYVLLEKLNCCIFRHGTEIISGKQIDSHATKEQCEYYINNKLIYGCGKPFKVVKNDCSLNDDNKSINEQKYIAIICDYI